MANIPDTLQYYKSDGTRVLTSGVQFSNVYKTDATGYFYGSNKTQLQYYNSHTNGETTCCQWEELRDTGFYIEDSQIQEVTAESICNFGAIIDSVGDGNGYPTTYFSYEGNNIISTVPNTSYKHTYTSPLGIKPKYIIIILQGAGGGGGGSGWNYSSAGGGSGGLWAGVIDLSTAKNIRISRGSVGLWGSAREAGGNAGTSTIDVSTDGSTWTTIVKVHGGTGGGIGGDPAGSGGQVETIDYTHIKCILAARVGTSGGTRNNAGGNRAELTIRTSSKIDNSYMTKTLRAHSGGSSGGDGWGGGGAASFYDNGGDGKSGNTSGAWAASGAGGGGAGNTGVWPNGGVSGGRGGAAVWSVYCYGE